MQSHDDQNADNNDLVDDPLLPKGKILRCVYFRLTPVECLLGSFAVGLVFVVASFWAHFHCIPEISELGGLQVPLEKVRICWNGVGYLSRRSFNWVFGPVVIWPLFMYFLANFYRALPTSLRQLDSAGRVIGLDGGLTTWTKNLFVRRGSPKTRVILWLFALSVDAYTFYWHYPESWIWAPIFNTDWSWLRLFQASFVLAAMVWQIFVFYLYFTFLLHSWSFCLQLGRMATLDSKLPHFKPEPNDPLRQFGFKHLAKILLPIILAASTSVVYNVLFFFATSQKPLWEPDFGIWTQSAIVYFTIWLIIRLISPFKSCLEAFKDNYEDCLAAKFITDPVPKNQEVVEKELRLLAEQSFSVTRPLVRGSFNIGSIVSLVLMLIRSIEPLMKSLPSLIAPP